MKFNGFIVSWFTDGEHLKVSHQYPIFGSFLFKSFVNLGVLKYVSDPTNNSYLRGEYPRGLYGLYIAVRPSEVGSFEGGQ